MYSPKLKEDQIIRLHQLSKKAGVPMTILLREAVEIYLKKKGSGQIPTSRPKTS